MKKICLLLALLLLLILPACKNANTVESNQPCVTHTDLDDNGLCDLCSTTVIVSFDIYAINDLHGKLADADTHPGVDEMTTYLKNARETQDNVIILSVGDMWQGSSESNLTKGFFTTEWMNDLDFAAMTLGNHEYDWGEDPITENAAIAEFPFLAINIYDAQTDSRVEYCQPSVVVEADGVQIGIIGAIGDCYSSISSDKVADVYFKTGSQLTQLVKDESDRLRSLGVDFIIYVLHDGLGSSSGNTITPVTSSKLSSYYDYSLSNGYVDLVFEGHTHQNYLLLDEYGVFHLQNGGDNKKGIMHASITINVANSNTEVTGAQLVSSSTYTGLADDPIVENLLNKYQDQIGFANQVLGYNATRRSGDVMRQLAADLYYSFAMEQWGEEYDIALAGGFFTVRSPGYLDSGNVTYADLQTLFPFDNNLVLCKVQGRDLKSKFFESSNSNYFISYGDYGSFLRNNIDLNAYYYIVTDTYTSTYAPNRLEEVARLDEELFARDLLAQYISSGGLQ